MHQYNDASCQTSGPMTWFNYGNKPQNQYSVKHIIWIIISLDYYKNILFIIDITIKLVSDFLINTCRIFRTINT